jgi:hypothetical protein
MMEGLPRQPDTPMHTTEPMSQRRRRQLAAGVALVMVGTIGAISITLLGSPPHPTISTCTVTSGSGRAPYAFTPDQAQNATIIAAVGIQRGMPDHAVTIALATALQESHLMNLPYGDRDSLGLFQQRPSQGWGTSSQILDPTYAATAFYEHLAQLPGWESMPVTEAAQLVQGSATPNAYAQWESESRALAIATTGERPAGLSCQLSGFGGAKPSSAALATAVATELGPHALAAPPSTKAGWQFAAWAVAHAYNYNLTSVSYRGQQWSWNSTATTWAAVPVTTSVVTSAQ